MAALLKRGLEEDGYAVDVASTGPDACGRRPSSTTTPSCWTLMLPGLDGFEVCRQLREQAGGCRSSC